MINNVGGFWGVLNSELQRIVANTSEDPAEGRTSTAGLSVTIHSSLEDGSSSPLDNRVTPILKGPNPSPIPVPAQPHLGPQPTLPNFGSPLFQLDSGIPDEVNSSIEGTCSDSEATDSWESSKSPSSVE